MVAAVLAFLPGNRKGLGKADCSEANRYSTVFSWRREDVTIQLSMVALYLYAESSVKPAYSGMSTITLAPVPNMSFHKIHRIAEHPRRADHEFS